MSVFYFHTMMLKFLIYVGIFFSMLSRVACSEKTETSNISINFKVESPGGKGLSYCMVNELATEEQEPCVTADGRCNIALPQNTPFSIYGKALDPEYQDLYIIGSSGEAPGFNYTTYMGTRNEAKAVYKLLDLEYSAESGIIVVGVDISNDGSNQPSTLIIKGYVFV